MVVTRYEIRAAGEHKKYSTDIKKKKIKRKNLNHIILLWKADPFQRRGLILLPVKLIRATARS